MDDPPPNAPVPSHRASSSPAVPFREDCWSEEATATLIEVWGERYLDLNRGNLRQNHWQEVADAVDAKHAVNKKTRRTDVQCKNRIDTLKKKFKIEKAKASSAGSDYASPWSFFHILDPLIGPLSAKKPTTLPASAPAVRNKPHLAQRQRSGFSSPVPVALRSALAKRLPAPAGGDSMFRKNFSAFAAAAAAAEKKMKVENSDDSRSSSAGGSGRKRRRVTDDDDENDGVDGGYKELAQAIARFGEIYERVEGSKQRQMIELEKQRMQFAKDLEIHRMELLVDMQLQFEKSKRQKGQPNGAAGTYS